MKYLILPLFIIFTSCTTTRPRIKCFDPNNSAADTSYFVNNDGYRGFIFLKDYSPLLKVSDTRFTPTLADIESAENILKSKGKYGRNYARQYIGHINSSGDSLVYVRLLKDGLKEPCFGKIVAVGFGEQYERNQRTYNINITRKKVE